MDGGEVGEGLDEDGAGGASVGSGGGLFGGAGEVAEFAGVGGGDEEVHGIEESIPQGLKPLPFWFG